MPRRAVAFAAAILALSTAAARAETWQEVSKSYYYYNSDRLFRDRASGFVVTETASATGGGKYEYSLVALDCGKWRIYGLADRGADGRFAVYGDWRTNPSVSGPVPNGSFAQTLAQMLCPRVQSLPTGDLP